MHAEERLSAFLLNLSQRFEARGYSRSDFVLRMTRAEIGSYLGLKLETVSRALSRFAQDGLIDVNQKRIQITDPDGLRAIVAGHVRAINSARLSRRRCRQNEFRSHDRWIFAGSNFETEIACQAPAFEYSS